MLPDGWFQCCKTYVTRSHLKQAFGAFKLEIMHSHFSWPWKSFVHEINVPNCISGTFQRWADNPTLTRGISKHIHTYVHIALILSATRVSSSRDLFCRFIHMFFYANCCCCCFHGNKTSFSQRRRREKRGSRSAFALCGGTQTRPLWKLIARRPCLRFVFIYIVISVVVVASFLRAHYSCCLLTTNYVKPGITHDY